jgi:paraquat-inducible protein A
MKLYERTFVLRLLLVISLILLILGISLPMLTITQLLVIENQFSVVSGILALWDAHKYGLFVLISLFSLGMPFFKLLLIFRLLSTTTRSEKANLRILHVMHDYGRWAMLDVMVVAMLIVSVKMGALASIDIHAGLYVFATAILLIMFLTQMTVKRFTPQTA